MLSLEEIARHYPPHLQHFKRTILREYLQHKILECIYDYPYANKLVFMGGTALRILHEHAAFNRPRIMGRDFYDILFLWQKTQPDYDYLKQKLKIDTSKQLKEYLIKKSSEVNFELLTKDLEPFVFQPKDAKKIIHFPEWVKTINL